MKIFQPSVLLPGLALLLCGSSFAVASEPPDEPKPIANVEPVGQSQSEDQGVAVASVIDGYEKAYDDYRSASASAKSAKSAEEKRELKRPTIEDFAVDMMTAVELDVESQEAFDGLYWLYEKTKRKDAETADQYLTLMMEHHSDRKRMGGVANWIAYADNSGKTERNLQKIFDNNKHKNDQATTVLSFIKHYQAVKELQIDAVQRKFAEKKLGEEGMKYIDSRSRDELNLLIDKYLAIGFEEYGDISYGRGTFADRLEPYRFVHTRLRIGVQAPDIIGEDIAGVEFKLSDYRGKVVMIDFWGDW